MTEGQTTRAAAPPVFDAATDPSPVRVVGGADTSVAGIVELVAGDPELTARVLAVAGSSTFGDPGSVREVDRAVSLLGPTLCQALAIAGSCGLLDGRHGPPHARDHAIRTACATRWLAARVGLGTGEAFAAGLLHDVGELLLSYEQPEAYAAAHDDWSDVQEQLHGERAVFGTDHALVAREQLAAWRLPGVVVDAVGDHHRPDLCYPDLSTAVITAEELVDPEADWNRRFELFAIVWDERGAARAEIREHAAELAGLLPPH